MCIEGTEHFTGACSLRLEAILFAHLTHDAKIQQITEHDSELKCSPSHGSSISKHLYWGTLVYRSQMKCSDCTKKDYLVETQ